LLVFNDSWSKSLGIGEKVVTDSNIIFGDKEIDAVIICSSTNTHVEYIEKALSSNKHIFCEKPVSQDIEKLEYISNKLQANNFLKFQIGFNRRFDNNIQRIKEKIVDNICLIKFISNDPKLPSSEYLSASGGLLFDMTIHDFDLMRYLVNDEILSVFCTGSVLIDPNLHEIQDIDTCITQIKFDSGALGSIINCRQSPVGYDQRIEVLTRKYNLRTENIRESYVITEDQCGSVFDNPKNFFIERYRDSYVNELKSFFDSIIYDTNVSVGCLDLIEAVRLVKAGNMSLEKNIPISPRSIIK
jgi:myo-inositol 2-dehydrogenase/D-chiro-inositol 1-dehydrogenase